jgi:hypothetical protein
MGNDINAENMVEYGRDTGMFGFDRVPGQSVARRGAQALVKMGKPINGKPQLAYAA